MTQTRALTHPRSFIDTAAGQPAGQMTHYYALLGGKPSLRGYMTR